LHPVGSTNRALQMFAVIHHLETISPKEKTLELITLFVKGPLKKQKCQNHCEEIKICLHIHLKQ